MLRVSIVGARCAPGRGVLPTDSAHAAAAADRAGNDMIMTTESFEGARDAVGLGMLEDTPIEAAVARIVTLRLELALFEDPRHPDTARPAAVIGCRARGDLNRNVARRTFVLLRNDDKLPLARDFVVIAERRATGGDPTPPHDLQGP